MKNSREYYCLNIIVNIRSFSPLNTNLNTIMKYYRKQALNKKLKLMGGAMKFFTKKLLGHEIFSSMIPWATKYFLKNFEKPSGLISYIFHICSLKLLFFVLVCIYVPCGQVILKYGQLEHTLCFILFRLFLQLCNG